MLGKIYFISIILSIVASIPYMLRMMKYNKQNGYGLWLDIIVDLLMIILLCIPILNILLGYLYLCDGLLSSDKEFKKMMEKEIHD